MLYFTWINDCSPVLFQKIDIVNSGSSSISSIWLVKTFKHFSGMNILQQVA